MRAGSAVALVLALALLASCNAPDTVAKFCSSAVATLKTGRRPVRRYEGLLHPGSADL